MGGSTILHNFTERRALFWDSYLLWVSMCFSMRENLSDPVPLQHNTMQLLILVFDQHSRVHAKNEPIHVTELSNLGFKSTQKKDIFQSLLRSQCFFFFLALNFDLCGLKLSFSPVSVPTFWYLFYCFIMVPLSGSNPVKLWPVKIQKFQILQLRNEGVLTYLLC